MKTIIRTQRKPIDNLKENVLNILVYPLLFAIIVILNNNDLRFILLLILAACILSFFVYFLEFKNEVTEINFVNSYYEIKYFSFLKEKTIRTNKLRIFKGKSIRSAFRIDFEIDGGYTFIQQSNGFWTDKQFSMLKEKIEELN